MEESTRWSPIHKYKELPPMGRGPGVRATSATSVQIDFRYKGKRCRERIALPPTPANLKYARRLKATIDHEIATNTFDYARHFPESPRARSIQTPGKSIRRALQYYCDSLGGQLEPETVDEYRLDAEKAASGLEKIQPEITLETLTRAHVRAWVATLTLSKKRIDNLLIPLRGALNQAVDDEKIKASPLANFRVRRTEKPEDTIDPFTPAEIESLSKQSLGFIWKFWAWSGLRTGELIGLTWGDVEVQYSSLRIRRAIRVGREKSPKTASGVRSILLLPTGRESLRSLTRGQDSDPVFINPNTGRHWHEDRALARAFRRDCKASGVRYRYPYQLRHTFATWALSSGENPAWAAKYMGHKDLQTFFRVYAKWMPILDPNAGSRMVLATKSKAA